MSKRFFTSDWHLGSSLINKYAKRPFTSAEEAAVALVINCNGLVKKEDAVFHVGDFWLSGKDSHGHEVDENRLANGFDDYLRTINARFVLLSGNHDDGHNCESDMKSMVLDLNHNYRNVYANHYPSMDKHYHGLVGLNGKIQINLCGHVHDSWLMYYDAEKNVLNYNVGVDVHGYKPVQDSEITQDLDFIFQHKFFFLLSGKLDRETMAQMKRGDEEAAHEHRKQHKAERYLKKGLTPEECERRKREAMAKKGLDPSFKKPEKKKVECNFSHEDAMQFGCIPPDVVDVAGMSVQT